MTTYEMYDRLKQFLATTANYGKSAQSISTHRKVEFVPEENRPKKCYLPVRWVAPHKKLWDGWTRLTYSQFCDAYDLDMEPL